MSLEQKILDKARSWTSGPYDKETQQEVKNIIEKGGDDLIDAFYKDLDFGTGGLRGVMGAGTNRINRYTLGMATQGLSNYLLKSFPGEQVSVAIAHDSRNNSRLFATQVAEVLSANGIGVYLFEDLRPTPELSFSIRQLQCNCGIVLTASHNPPEYNGYKVYWQDGGQLVPPHDRGVIEEVRKVGVDDIRFDGNAALIKEIGEEVDNAYLANIRNLSFGNAGKNDLKVVFTSIHGTSITLMPQAFELCGFPDFHIVDGQAEPDGNFPTVQSPNPEEAEALSMAVLMADSIEADMVIGTDPDADRVGIAVRDNDGQLALLNGNQAASVMIYYLLEQWKANERLDGQQFIAKTIVTTDLLEKIAEHYKVDCPSCLTGFKWIAQMVRESEKQFIGGGEESYGYMIGDFVRDKDAIASAVVLAEAAAWAKSKGSSFYGILIDVYQQFGFYLEDLVSMTKKGKSGAEEIAKMMEDFRTNTPESISGERVVEVLDYQSSEAIDVASGARKSIDLPKSNVVQLITDAGSKITARPSGTEPKIKFYISVNTELKDKSDFENVKKGLLERIDNIKNHLGL